MTNFLVEGVSCSGKSTACGELHRRGYQVVNGDLELAYQGDPLTGVPTDTHAHENHLWRVELVEALIADDEHPITFFCGGSRNFSAFIHLFDGVYVLDIDTATLIHRLNERPEGEWGARPDERELVIRLHQTKEDTPDGVLIDATQPLDRVVDEIVRLSRASPPSRM